MKKLQLIGGIVLVFILLAGVFKNSIIKSAVTIGATKVVGAAVKIDKFSLGVFNQSVSIKGFRLYNPKGFPEGVILDIPEINVKYDLEALFKKKVHLPLVIINLREVGLVKDQEGRLNVDSLKVAQKKEDAPRAEDKGKEASKQIPMQIDELRLTIGKVVYKDFSVKGSPSIRTFEVGIKDKVYRDITSGQQLAALVLVESMKGAGIKGAGIYGATVLLGVGFLPVGVAGVLIGKDSAQADFDVDYNEAYDTCIEVTSQMGTITKENKETGIIKASIRGSNIALKLEKKGEASVQITVSARKYLIPRPEVAGGVLHQISEKIK